jgi:hypothetical protein
MRKIHSFLMVFLAMFLFWGTAKAADLPTISPADGSNDVWYHIQLEKRIWGIGGSSGTTNGGSIKGWYLDQGAGKMLRNIEVDTNEPGTRWKLVATGSSTEYKLISQLGNTIAYASSAIGTSGDANYVKADRYYTTTPSSQVFTILNPNGAYLGLSLKGAGGIDKSNNDLYFDKWGPNAEGGAISFVAAEPMEEAFLFPPANVDFRDVPVGKSATKTLAVAGTNLTGDLSYSIAGAGFSVTPQTNTANGGTAEITFTPTVKQVYTAILTITNAAAGISVTDTLKGNADFAFPIQISEGANEHWYYIQFYRQAANNKVLQAGGETEPITQALIAGGQDNQLWKIIGDWDEYKLIPKSGDELGMTYDAAEDKNHYVLDMADYASEFSFVRFKDTENWQLFNNSAGYIESGQESETKRYLNDKDNEGTALSNYEVDDAGNRLVFIPKETVALKVGLESLDYGTAPINVGASIKKTIPVGGLNLTAPITATITGTGAAVFALTQSNVPAAGGEFEVTFTPTAVASYTAELILTSGESRDTVQLKGKGSVFPFVISSVDNSNEHWYYIQFQRQQAKAFTDKGANADVEQTDWDANQEPNNAQTWKVTGTWDNFKFVSKLGNSLVRGTYTDEYGFYKTVAGNNTGDKHSAVEKTTGTNLGWGFINTDATESESTLYMNDNGGAHIGLYGYLDEGGPLKFVPASGKYILPSVTVLNHGDVNIGLKSEKVLTVTGNNTTAPITYALEGADAGVFTVAITSGQDGENNQLLAAGGTLKVTYLPTATRDYVAILKLSSTGTDDVIVLLEGKGTVAELPVTISTSGNDYWYNIYFNRRYSSGDSNWKVWTAGLEGETITQTAFAGRVDQEFAISEQLWKFVVAPSQTGYLAVAYNGLAATTPPSSDLNYTLDTQANATPLTFKKEAENKWVLLKDTGSAGSLNDRSGSAICNYGTGGEGNQLTFLPAIVPDPIRIQVGTKTVTFDDVEAGEPAVYSGNIVLKGFGLTSDITLALSGEGASAYSVVLKRDSTAVTTLPSTGDTLKVIFNPTARQAYEAKLNLTSAGAAAKEITLSGSGALNLPVKLSTAAEPFWYTVGFNRSTNKWLTVEAANDTLVQRTAVTASETQLFRFEGSVATGYQLINHDERVAAYDSTSVVDPNDETKRIAVKTYFMKPQAQGDYFRFVKGVDANAGKWQMRNITNSSNGGYLCDKEGKGFQATNYSKNDAGNWLTFKSLIPDAIVSPGVDANDPVVSSVYYTLQGIRVYQPLPGNVYIQVNTHASKKTSATKFFLVK